MHLLYAIICWLLLCTIKSTYGLNIKGLAHEKGHEEVFSNVITSSPPAITESLLNDVQQQQQVDQVITENNNDDEVQKQLLEGDKEIIPKVSEMASLLHFQDKLEDVSSSRQLQTIGYMGAAVGVGGIYPASPVWSVYTMTLTNDPSGYKEFKTQSASTYSVYSYYTIVVNPPGPGYLLTASFTGNFNTESEYDFANLHNCDMTGTAQAAFTTRYGLLATSPCYLGSWSGITLPVGVVWSGKYGTAMTAILFSDSSGVNTGFTVRFTYSICPANSYCLAGSTSPTACPFGTSPAGSTTSAACTGPGSFMSAAVGALGLYPAYPGWPVYTMSLTNDPSGYKEYKTQSASTYSVFSYYTIVVNPPGPGYLLTASFVGTFGTELAYDYANLHNCDMTGTAQAAFTTTRSFGSTQVTATSPCYLGSWSGITLPVGVWSGKYGTAMTAILFSDSVDVYTGFTVRFTYSICPANSYCLAGSATPTACPSAGTSPAGSVTLASCIILPGFMSAAVGVGGSYPASPVWSAYTMSLTNDASGYKEFKTQSASTYSVYSYYTIVVNPPGPGYLLTASFTGNFNTESYFDSANLHNCDMTGTAQAAFTTRNGLLATSPCYLGSWSGFILPVGVWSGKYGTAMTAILFSDNSNVDTGFTVRFTSTPCPSGYYCVVGSITPIACTLGYWGVAGAVTASCSGQCTAGYYCPVPAISATQIQCAAGYYCPTGSSSMTPCQADYYSLAGSSVCIPSPCSSCVAPSFCMGKVCVAAVPYPSCLTCSTTSFLASSSYSSIVAPASSGSLLIMFELWGAGGGGTNGGNGAYISGVISARPGETFRGIVGSVNTNNQLFGTGPTFPDYNGCGGYSSTGTSGTNSHGNGGGRTALQRSVNGAWVEILTAGGGGGTGNLGTPGGSAGLLSSAASLSGTKGAIETVALDLFTCAGGTASCASQISGITFGAGWSQGGGGGGACGGFAGTSPYPVGGAGTGGTSFINSTFSCAAAIGGIVGTPPISSGMWNSVAGLPGRDGLIIMTVLPTTFITSCTLPTPTPTSSFTPSTTPSQSVTPTGSATAPVTPSRSSSMGTSLSSTPSGTVTGTLTGTVTGSLSGTLSGTGSETITQTITQTGSATSTSSLTGTTSPSPLSTSKSTPTSTTSSSPSPTPATTASPSPSPSPSISEGLGSGKCVGQSCSSSSLSSNAAPSGLSPDGTAGIAVGCLIVLLLAGNIVRLSAPQFFRHQRKKPISGVATTIPQQQGDWVPIVTNPLQTTAPPVTAAVVTVVTLPATTSNNNQWKLYKDDTDMWYVNTVTNETVWDLPSGDILVE